MDLAVIVTASLIITPVSSFKSAQLIVTNLANFPMEKVVTNREDGDKLVRPPPQILRAIHCLYHAPTSDTHIPMQKTKREKYVHH